MSRALAVGALIAVVACTSRAEPERTAHGAPDDGAADAGVDAVEGIPRSPFTSNFGCDVGQGGAGWLVASVLAASVYRRRARRGALAAVVATLVAVPTRAQPSAVAAHTSPVKLEPVPSPRRHVTVTYNPLTVIIGRYGGNAEVVPWTHHGVIATIYHLSTETSEATLSTRYHGIGGELGYRYYTGSHGPRGLFVGPSLLLGSFSAVPASGDRVEFTNIGGALDLGYQAIIEGRLVLGLAVGLQYTSPSVDIPRQELPASIYANAGVRPRWILAIGAAF